MSIWRYLTDIEIASLKEAKAEIAQVEANQQKIAVAMTEAEQQRDTGKRWLRERWVMMLTSPLRRKPWWTLRN
jgi:hypothetical protein